MVTALVEVLEVVVEIKMGDVSVEDIGVRDVLEGEVVLAVVVIIKTGVVCVEDVVNVTGCVVDCDWEAELVIVELDETEIRMRCQQNFPRSCSSCFFFFFHCFVTV